MFKLQLRKRKLSFSRVIETRDGENAHLDTLWCGKRLLKMIYKLYIYIQYMFANYYEYTINRYPSVVVFFF